MTAITVQTRRFYWWLLAVSAAVSVLGNALHAWTAVSAAGRSHPAALLLSPAVSAVIAALSPIALLAHTHGAALLMQTPTRRGRVSRVCALAVILLLCAGGFFLSFSALQELAQQTAVPAAHAWVFPVLVDGSIGGATIALLDLQATGPAVSGDDVEREPFPGTLEPLAVSEPEPDVDAVDVAEMCGEPGAIESAVPQPVAIVSVAAMPSGKLFELEATGNVRTVREYLDSPPFTRELSAGDATEIARRVIDEELSRQPLDILTAIYSDASRGLTPNRIAVQMQMSHTTVNRAIAAAVQVASRSITADGDRSGGRT